jgi:hypothetical protein
MKTYWHANLFLNDVIFGKVQFEDEKSKDDFFKIYNTLPEDNKWGFALTEWVDDEAGK